MSQAPYYTKKCLFGTPMSMALGTQKSKFTLLVFSVANEYDIW
jgi:hypothetical protein